MVVTAFGFVTLFVSALPLPLEIVPLCGAGILLVASTALLALLIKLVVVFFGPAAGVAEFIVSFRTFFSGWKTIM